MEGKLHNQLIKLPSEILHQNMTWSSAYRVIFSCFSYSKANQLPLRVLEKCYECIPD